VRVVWHMREYCTPYSLPKINHVSKNGGFSYLTWYGFSINEGGTPFNCHLNWKTGFFYIYLFGKRLHNGGLNWGHV